MSISIRALIPDDWRIVKELRLHALQTNPGIFSGHYADESIKPEEYWRETVDGNNKQVFGLFDGEILIGITAVFTWREDPMGQTGVMAYTFLKPEYRGQGLTKLIYEARISFALKHLPWKKLVIGHRDGNEPSRRAMLKNGFTFTHITRKIWPDGVEADEYHYEMDLNRLRQLTTR
jgi:RimJ/RimL family protein N-acetyltransferase